MIKLIIFDIDGVITDGAMLVDECGNEQKRISLKDVDAIFALKRSGFLLAAVTGEDTRIVSYFERRFPWDCFCKGIKKKKETVEEIIKSFDCTIEETCFIGDGEYDVEAIKLAGVGACPADAVKNAMNAADIILHNKGGNGCIWELAEIIKRYNNPNKEYLYFYERLSNHMYIFKNIISDYKLVESIIQVAKRISDIFSKGGQLFLCGNGGSAADAQHIATEFISRFYRERPGMNAEALTVNSSTITAVGNDYSFERVFVRQLEAKARKGDIVIGISTSGHSKNVLEALKYAKNHDIYTVLMTGGQCLQGVNDFTECILQIPSKDVPRIQEAHIFIGHLLAEYVEEDYIKQIGE